MTCIGTFTATDDGFAGRIETLTITSALRLVVAEPIEGGNAPDYRVLCGEGDTAFEVGAGWKHIGDKAGAFVAVVIDDPALVRPIRANLFRADKGNHVLMWSRHVHRSSGE